MNNRAQMTMAAKAKASGRGQGVLLLLLLLLKIKGWVSDSSWPLRLAVVTHTYCVQNKG